MKVVDFRIFCIQLGTFVYLQYLQDRRLPVMSVSFICITNPKPHSGLPSKGETFAASLCWHSSGDILNPVHRD
jgi:hypothetical protein